VEFVCLGAFGLADLAGPVKPFLSLSVQEGGGAGLPAHNPGAKGKKKNLISKASGHLP
jgi:hypothetical protein